MSTPVAEEKSAAVLRMESNLALLHDTLARTPIAGRFWLFGGLMLGIVREGGVLAHDTDDVDFAFDSRDVNLLHASFPALVAAGFAPHFRFPGALGEATEYSFLKDDAKFEFFRLTVDGGRSHYCNYGWVDGAARMNRCSIPAQPLTEIRWLDRPWLRARDADLELTALYGDWRTPDKGYNYHVAPSVDSTHPWDGSTYKRWGETYPLTGC